MLRLTSTSNERVKAARLLKNPKGRRESGLFLLEGPKLIAEALGSGLTVKTVFAEREFMLEHPELLAGEVYEVTRNVLEAICDARTPQQAAAVAVIPQIACKILGDGLYAALDRVQDPSNMGAIIRCADAMGAVGIILGEGCADPYAPKTVRAAMGSLFHVSIIRRDLPAELNKLRGEGFLAVAGHLRGEEALPESIGRRAVVVIGNEGSGVSDEVAGCCSALYRLRMRGRAESLNAAVAAGILLYEIGGRMETGI